MIQRQSYISCLRRLLTGVAGVACCLFAQAGVPVTTKMAMWEASGNLFSGLREYNPAVVFLLPGDGYTEVSASWEQRHSGALHYSFEGDGETVWQGKALGFVRRLRSAARGEAAYKKGIARNVRWSDAVDASRVGPYVPADTTGGNRHYEQYLLEGAMAVKMRKVLLGFSGNYRAEGSFRIRDPRPSTTVSELRLAGGGMLEGRRYHLGLAAAAGSYNQSVAISIATPDRKDYFYFLYGFGMYNVQLSSTSNYYTMDYSGYTAEASAFAVPVSDAGGWIAAGVFRRDETDANDKGTTPAVYRVDKINGYAGYKLAKNDNIHLFTVSIDRKAGKGTERYYETVVVDETSGLTDRRFLSESQKYDDNNTIACLNHQAIFNKDRRRLSTALTAGWQRREILYRSPAYRQFAEQWLAGASGSFLHTTDAALVRMTLSSAYNHTFREQLDVTDNLITRRQTIPDYQFMSASLVRSGISIMYAREVFSGSALSLTVDYSTTFNSRESGHRCKLTVALHL